MAKKRDVVYIIQAYEEWDHTQDIMKDHVQVEVFADSEKNAVKRASELIVKKFYRVKQIIEK